MSVIGPRPDPLDDINIYTEEQKKKLDVRPGITGYNQAYFRNAISQNDKFNNDLYYSKNISFKKLVGKTKVSHVRSSCWAVYCEEAKSCRWDVI